MRFEGPKFSRSSINCDGAWKARKDGRHGVSLSFAGFGHHPTQSGLVFGRDIYPHGPGLLLSGRHHGLGHPGGALLVAVTTMGADFCVEAFFYSNGH